MNQLKLIKLCLLFAFIGLSSTIASAQVERFRWTHVNPPDLAGFRVHMGPESRNYTTVLDVGMATLESQNLWYFDQDLTIVASTPTVYVALTAYSASEESDYSNERAFTLELPEDLPPDAPFFLGVRMTTTETGERQLSLEYLGVASAASECKTVCRYR